MTARGVLRTAGFFVETIIPFDRSQNTVVTTIIPSEQLHAEFTVATTLSL